MGPDFYNALIYLNDGKHRDIAERAKTLFICLILAP